MPDKNPKSLSIQQNFNSKSTYPHEYTHKSSNASSISQKQNSSSHASDSTSSKNNNNLIHPIYSNDKFYKINEVFLDNQIFIKHGKIDAEIFEIILKYIYTSSVDEKVFMYSGSDFPRKVCVAASALRMEELFIQVVEDLTHRLDKNFSDLLAEILDHLFLNGNEKLKVWTQKYSTINFEKIVKVGQAF